MHITKTVTLGLAIMLIVAGCQKKTDAVAPTNSIEAMTSENADTPVDNVALGTSMNADNGADTRGNPEIRGNPELRSGNETR
jgi:hypothetical protein